MTNGDILIYNNKLGYKVSQLTVCFLSLSSGSRTTFYNILHFSTTILPRIILFLFLSDLRVKSFITKMMENNIFDESLIFRYI